MCYYFDDRRDTALPLDFNRERHPALNNARPDLDPCTGQFEVTNLAALDVEIMLLDAAIAAGELS